MQALPTERFPFFHEVQLREHRDGHFEVDNAYYSLPPEYVTRQVWVRWDSRLVRIFNRRMEQIALHGKHEAGRFSTQGAHIHTEKITAAERGTTYLLGKARSIGPQTALWAEAMIAARGVAGVRVLMGLLNLAKLHSCELIEQACAVAVTYQAYRLRTVKELIKRKAPPQEQFDFLQEHPLSRPLGEYGQLVQESFRKER